MTQEEKIEILMRESQLLVNDGRKATKRIYHVNVVDISNEDLSEYMKKIKDSFNDTHNEDIASRYKIS